MTNFDEKMKQLKEESIAEFSLVAGTIGEARELIELVKSNGIKWFSGEPIDHMSEYIYKKMQTYPEKKICPKFPKWFQPEETIDNLLYLGTQITCREPR